MPTAPSSVDDESSSPITVDIQHILTLITQHEPVTEANLLLHSDLSNHETIANLTRLETLGLVTHSQNEYTVTSRAHVLSDIASRHDHRTTDELRDYVETLDDTITELRSNDLDTQADRIEDRRQLARLELLHREVG